MHLKTSPKVSVVIPIYNEEKYILKTLNAITSQSYKNYEVILVNNASTDASDEMIKYFIQKKHSTVEIIYQTEYRQGTNYARECGRRLATGSIIAMLDADCVPDFYWVENGAAELQKKNVLAATGAYYYYDASIFSVSYTHLDVYKRQRMLLMACDWMAKSPDTSMVELRLSMTVAVPVAARSASSAPPMAALPSL